MELNKLLGIHKNTRKKETEKEGVSLKPIVLTKKICNGGTSCTAFKDHEKQKTCFFYRKSTWEKKCTWLRTDIEHCSNQKAQVYFK